MCCCDNATVNGNLGYRYSPSSPPSVYPVNPPALSDGDTLLYDEPGRCGGIDSHSYHYRVVLKHSTLQLLVRHGGGTERIRNLSLYKGQREILATLDSNSRYWLLNALYHAVRDSARVARDSEADRWKLAAIEKRIKTRRKNGSITVRIAVARAKGE